MKKLVVINSFGPMASTLLAGLLEKMGFTNIPLRKLRLHEYLMGLTPLNSGVMQDRLRAILKSHSKKQLSGGVSVLDRNNQEPKALTDINKVADRLGSVTCDNIQDLYFNCHNMYCDAVVYKNIDTNPDWQIEMTVDIHRYDSEALYQSYQNNFDDVRMIHLHRPFEKWINSLASQTFLNPNLKERLMFFPHLRYADFIGYERAVAKMPGLHFNFDDWFEIPIENLSKTIADNLGVDVPRMELRHESFDMYGKIRPYDVAFTKFDDGVVFLSPSTIDYFSSRIADGSLGRFWPAFVSWLLYIRDMYKYRRNIGKSWL